MKESQRTEWKESWRDESLRWLCGFANAEGGVLVIGRNDKGVAVGVTDAKKLLEDLPNKIRDVLGIMADVRLVHDAGLLVSFPFSPEVIARNETADATGEKTSVNTSVKTSVKTFGVNRRGKLGRKLGRKLGGNFFGWSGMPLGSQRMSWRPNSESPARASSGRFDV